MRDTGTGAFGLTVVHIGLGKTGTTALQKYVFPVVANDFEHAFNSKQILPFLRYTLHFSPTDTQLSQFHANLAAKKHFISFESLACWNPMYWEKAADRNLKLFGPDAKILISFREPKAWMTSVYQQVVHEGNVLAPEHFFLNEQHRHLIDGYSIPSAIEYLNVDVCDFARLKKIYSDRFNTVICVDYSEIKEMKFVEELFDVNDAQAARYRDLVSQAPSVNRAYSARSMRLTMAREHFLRRWGLQTFGTTKRRLEDFRILFDEGFMIGNHDQAEIKSLPMSPKRFGRKPRKGLFWQLFQPTWRHFLQKRIDAHFSYEKYQLPENINLNDEMIEKNRAFLKTIRRN